MPNLQHLFRKRRKLEGSFTPINTLKGWDRTEARQDVSGTKYIERKETKQAQVGCLTEIILADPVVRRHKGLCITPQHYDKAEWEMSRM